MSIFEDAKQVSGAIATSFRNSRQKVRDDNVPIVQDQDNQDPVELIERVKPRFKTTSGSNAVVFQWGPGGFSDETNMEGSLGKTSARWGGVSWFA